MPVLTMETSGEDHGGDSLEDSETASIPTIDQPGSVDISSEISARAQTEDNKTKPPAKISRNYKCEKCSFASRKSRAFLYHMVDAHQSKIDIFACSYCDYCSQHKIKMQRHCRINHKIVLGNDDVKPEHAFIRTQIQRQSPVKPVKKVRSTFITKTVPGKKLTVKFMKPSSATSTLPAPKPVQKQHTPYLPSPIKSSQSMEHLSKVVDEVPLGNGNFIYKCKECQFTNEDKQKVAKHAVSWHVDTKSFSCTYCDYITFDRNDFMAHRQVHRNEHQFRCDECTYSTDFRPNMDRHIMNHKNPFPFTCSFCTYGCGSEAAIRRHMLMNHDPVQTNMTTQKSVEKKTKLPVPKSVETLQKTLACGIEANNVHVDERDDKEGSPDSDRDESMEVDTVDGNIDADATVGDKTVDGQDPNQKVKGTVTQFLEKDNGKLLCPVCKLKYKRSSDLNRHMKRKHGSRLREYVEEHFNAILPPIGDSAPTRPPKMAQRSTQHVPLSMVNSRGEVGFSMEYLDYGTEDFMDMDDAYDTFDSFNTPQDSPGREGTPVGDDGLGGYNTLSSFSGTTKDGDDEAQGPSDKVDLNCPHCRYIAKWPSDLQRHIAVHSMERRFKCTYCPKSYKYIGDMNVHIRKDHGQEPGTVKVEKIATFLSKKMSPALYKCPCCSYSSTYKSEVDRHTKLHGDEKTFQCKNCEYQSYWRGDMRRHMYKHHPELMKDGTAVNDLMTTRKDKLKLSSEKALESEMADEVLIPSSETSILSSSVPMVMPSSDTMPRAGPFVSPDIPKSGPFISPDIPKSGPFVSPDMPKSGPFVSPDIPRSGPFISPGPALSVDTYGDTEDLASTVEPILDQPEPSSLAKLSVFVEPENTEPMTSSGTIPAGPFVSPGSISGMKPKQTSALVSPVFPSVSPSKANQQGKTLAAMAASQEQRAGSKSPTPSPIKELGGGMYQCTYCGFTANAPSKMNMHIATHTNLKRYKCPICGRRANWKWDISKHIKRDHNDFETQVVKLSKQEAEDTIQEYMEGYPTVRRDHHLNVTPERQIPHLDGVKFFKCSVCDFSGEKKLSVSRHISVMHSKEVARIVVIKQMPKDANSQVTPIKTSTQEMQSTTPSKTSPQFSYMQVTPQTPDKPSPQVTPSKQDLQITPSKISPQIAHSLINQQLTASKLGPKLTPSKASPQLAATLASLQMNAMNIAHSPQITQSIQITQSTPITATSLNHVASPAVTPVYEPLQSPVPRQPAQQQIATQQQTAVHQQTVDEKEKEISDRPFMCSDCGKRGVTKGDVKRHYHYAHPNQEIRIVYLGDGSQSVYAAKSDVGQFTQEKKVVLSYSSSATSTELDAPYNVISAPANVSSGNNSSRSGALPHPKVLGYIRPYKCNICGRRSNWKWDLNNHIRDKHQGKAKVITLDENEAKATLNHYMKVELPVLLGTVLKEPDKTDVGVGEPEIPNRGNFKQMKCSHCNYRANCRTDVLRHIARKHASSRARIVVLDCETARRTLPSYTYSSLPHIEGEDKGSKVAVTGRDFIMEIDPIGHQLATDGGAQSSDHIMQGQEQTTGQTTTDSGKYLQAVGQLPPAVWSGLEKKYWKCSVCPYSNEVKVEVLKHMGKHNMKAYKCTACDYNSNFRSGVYRHIRFKHGGEKTASCQLTIKLVKEGPGLDSTGNQIMPEGVHIAGTQDTSEALSPTLLTVAASPSSSPANVSGSPTSPQKEPDNPLICEKFYCKKCLFQSRWRSCVCRHLRDKHKIHDYTMYIMKKVIDVSGHKPSTKTSTQAMMSPPSMLPPAASPTKAASVDSRSSGGKPKNFLCSICPYRTYKSKMLKFHMSCHKPQPGVRQVKCKYCPYYVSGSRLLTQHMQLHLRHPEGPFVHPGTPPSISPQKVPKSPDIPKRHSCEKCPYTTNSKNDFMYHKQFHRPKPTADFKCEHCEYWVTHKRLLKQHMKVHEGLDFDSSNVSAVSTPTKSDYSEHALVYDTVEIAAIKQRIIASKITPSISMTPVVSPMKLASNCTMGNKRGFFKKDGSYRKIHKCRLCPYMNVRPRNLRLHELMHGKRSASHPLMKCPHCNYFVGSKGLLAHHLKVHQPDYGMDFLPSVDDASSDRPSEASEDSEMDQPIPIQSKVDTLFDIARFKKFGCEKCPYASAKRSHFQRHVELHGSKQKCKCDFCDYSVPSMNLLSQHTKLHFEPNQNLLAAQSILNLQHLPDMPADVALASMMTNADSKHPVSVTHDHLELYENAPEDCEPKKLYRCDRCPYANIRRDHLLAHLRCHMTKNEFVCPYCDYSVGKTHVLLQHVKVHFSPLPELSDWLVQSGDVDRIKLHKEKDIREAIELATLFQAEKKSEKEENEGNGAEDKKDKDSDEIDKVSSTADKIDGAAVEMKTDLKPDAGLSSSENNKVETSSDKEKIATEEVSFTEVEVDPEISFKVMDKSLVKDEKEKEDNADNTDAKLKSGETTEKKHSLEKEEEESKEPVDKNGEEKMDTDESTNEKDPMKSKSVLTVNLF